MTLLKAFLIGGALCAFAQLVVIRPGEPAIVMVSAVSAGAVLSRLGLYGPLAKFAGAGATIPLFGFGHAW
jgi:stage V sporulation protein AE